MYCICITRRGNARSSWYQLFLGWVQSSSYFYCLPLILRLGLIHVDSEQMLLLGCLKTNWLLICLRVSEAFLQVLYVWPKQYTGLIVTYISNCFCFSLFAYRSWESSETLFPSWLRKFTVVGEYAFGAGDSGSLVRAVNKINNNAI